MFDLLKSIVWGLFRHSVVGSSAEADILALRHQVAVLRRQFGCRAKSYPKGPSVFAALYRVQPDVLQSISIVRPETVVRWHRAGFRLYWKQESWGKAGRSRTPGEVRALLREISSANPIWDAPRIHGELLKLGIKCRNRQSRMTWFAEDTRHHRTGAPFCGTKTRRWGGLSNIGARSPRLPNSVASTMPMSESNIW